MAAQPGTARCAGPAILIMTDHASVSMHLQGHQICHVHALHMSNDGNSGNDILAFVVRPGYAVLYQL